MALCGKGTFSEIYSARDTATGEIVAVKVELTNIVKSVLDWEGTVLEKVQGLGHLWVFRRGASSYFEMPNH